MKKIVFILSRNALGIFNDRKCILASKNPLYVTLLIVVCYGNYVCLVYSLGFNPVLY
jgi:hypothetical protein